MFATRRPAAAATAAGRDRGLVSGQRGWDGTGGASPTLSTSAPRVKQAIIHAVNMDFQYHFFGAEQETCRFFLALRQSGWTYKSYCPSGASPGDIAARDHIPPFSQHAHRARERAHRAAKTARTTLFALLAYLWHNGSNIMFVWRGASSACFCSRAAGKLRAEGRRPSARHAAARLLNMKIWRTLCAQHLLRRRAGMARAHGR